MSPSPIPSFDAVCGLISTHVLHIAVLIGSGISCIHGRCAVDPSRNACDENGRTWNGYWLGSPSKLGARGSGLTDRGSSPESRAPSPDFHPALLLRHRPGVVTSHGGLQHAFKAL